MKTALGVMAAAVLAAGLVGCDAKDAEKAKSTVADAAKKTGDAVKETATKAADAATDAAKAAGDKVAETAKAAGDAGKELVDKAKAAVSEDAKKAFDGYVGEIGKTNGLLEKITNVDSAKSALADLAKSVTSLNAASGLLDKLPAEIKSSLMNGEGKGLLEKATSTFKGHVDRLTKDPLINGLLGDTLKQFKLVG